MPAACTTSAPTRSTLSADAPAYAIFFEIFERVIAVEGLGVTIDGDVCEDAADALRAWAANRDDVSVESGASRTVAMQPRGGDGWAIVEVTHATDVNPLVAAVRDYFVAFTRSTMEAMAAHHELAKAAETHFMLDPGTLAVAGEDAGLSPEEVRTRRAGRLLTDDTFASARMKRLDGDIAQLRDVNSRLVDDLRAYKRRGDFTTLHAAHEYATIKLMATEEQERKLVIERDTLKNHVRDLTAVAEASKAYMAALIEPGSDADAEEKAWTQATTRWTMLETIYV